MKVIRYFALLLIVLTNPLYADDSSVERFMRECGLELARASDFKVEDQEFFEFSNHIIHETIKAYSQWRIGDLVAVGVVVLTRLAQELQKLDGEIPHNPKNAHNLLVIANYKLEEHSLVAGDLLTNNITTRHINLFSERYAETSMISLYTNIYIDRRYNDTGALSRLHWYYRFMHPYEKEPVQKEEFLFCFPAGEKIKNFRQLSCIAVKTLLITAIMQSAVTRGIPRDVQDIIYQWNNDERISPNDQIKIVARYIKNMDQKDIDLIFWNLFGDRLIDAITPPCKGCETCKSAEMVIVRQIIPSKLAWLPDWILKRLY